MNRDRGVEFAKAFLEWVYTDKPVLVDGHAYNRFQELIEHAKSVIPVSSEHNFDGDV